MKALCRCEPIKYLWHNKIRNKLPFIVMDVAAKVAVALTIVTIAVVVVVAVNIK